MKMKYLFLTATTLIIFCSWTIHQKSEIKKLEWIVGTWENKTARGNIYETWSKKSEEKLSGISYIIQNKDTILFETISIIEERSKLFYIPIVKNQNGGLPVQFALKTISSTQFVFENTKHDFPQIISYTKISSDSLVAEISGIKNGKERKQSFSMKRLKE